MATAATEIEVVRPEVPARITPAEIKQRVVAIQELMRDVLKDGVDFGRIPGMPQTTPPSLFKPGSEQILAMFQMAVEPIVEDLSGPDVIRYRVHVRITHAPSRTFLGAGIGECSSNETKYKWRKTYSRQEFDHTPEDRRRVKFYRYKNKQNAWVEAEDLQIRQEPDDLANTILKMAKKRAQIDATLTVTGASSMFSQDLEDLTEEARQATSGETFEDGSPVNEPVATTKKKETAAPDARKSGGAQQAAPQPAEVQPPARPTQASAPAATSSSSTTAHAQSSAPPAAATNGKHWPGTKVGEYVSDAQRRRLYAIQKSAGKTDADMKQILKQNFEIESSKAIPQSEGYSYGIYEWLVDWVDSEFKFHVDEFPVKTLGAKKNAPAEPKAEPVAMTDEDW